MAEPAAVPAPPPPLPLRFTGSGPEFFRIWTVNVCLSILTLGIYSAWAKVRTHRYFWGHTQLDGSSFAYLASPVAILKGRLLAMGFLASAGVATAVFPPAEMVFSLLFLALIPWAVVRSMQFRARNTAYRGVRFDFAGRYGEALRAFVVLPVLTPFTLGLLFPHMLYRQKQLLVDRSVYGTTAFHLEARSRAFYGLALRTLGWMLLAGSGAGVASLAHPILLAVVGPPLFLLVAAYWTAASSNLVYGSARLGPHRLESRQRALELLGIYVGNVLGILLTLGLFIPFARVRTARYRLSRLTLHPAGELDSFVARERQEVESLGAELGEMLDIDIGL